jgi:hypothetical protein
LKKYKAYNVSNSPTTVEYRFGIQVPRGIRNVISLDKKNKNNLWQQAIQTELKQLTDYETFIVLHSGEDIPREYQNIPYHIVFDVNYDPRHKARLVPGGNRSASKEGRHLFRSSKDGYYQDWFLLRRTLQVIMLCL